MDFRMPLVLITSVLVSSCLAAPPPEDWITFSSGRSGNGDIYAVQPGGGVPTLVVGTEASEGTVRYDPSARRLVHSRFDSLGVMLVSRDAELFLDPNGDVAPVWSATGRIAYVIESEDGADLFLADRSGDDQQRITSDAAIERYPAWHPDGRQLVYAKRLASGWDLHVLNVETGREDRVTYDGAYVGHPNWSPNGDMIAFDRMYGEQTEIVVLDVESGEIRRLTDNSENDLLPSWSADASLIAFAGARGENWDIWTVATGSGAIERITNDDAFDGGPVFVPASTIN